MTALVDSYSTLYSGVPNFLLVSLALSDLGYKSVGVRLDSGDLAALSIECKKEFRRVGKIYGREEAFAKFKVVASNDINEESIRKLKEAGH